MNAVVKEEKNMIEPKKEVEDTVELKEPKVELIDEMDVKMEEIDKDEYKHKAVKVEEDCEYQHIIPHEYRDYMEQRDIEQKPVNNKRRTAECQICGKNIVFHCFLSVENHAVTHTNLVKYSCPIEECDYKNWHLCSVTRHLKNVHKFVNPTAKDVLRMELSHEENSELLKKTSECFPGVNKTVRKSSQGDAYNCQLCQTSITESTSVSTFCRRNHASRHTDFMLYKCMKQDCDFKTKHQTSVVRHQQLQHEMIAKRKPTKIELTIEQKLERERMVIQCFPELKEDSGYRIGLIEKGEDTNIEKTKEEELEEKPTAVMDYEDDIQLSGRKRKADQGTFEITKKKKV